MMSPDMGESDDVDSAAGVVTSPASTPHVRSRHSFDSSNAVMAVQSDSHGTSNGRSYQNGGDSDDDNISDLQYSLSQPQEVPQHQVPLQLTGTKLGNYSQDRTDHAADESTLAQSSIKGEAVVLPRDQMNLLNENAELRKMLASTQSERDGLQQQLTEARDEINTTSGDLYSEIRRLQSELLSHTKAGVPAAGETKSIPNTVHSGASESHRAPSIISHRSAPADYFREYRQRHAKLLSRIATEARLEHQRLEAREQAAKTLQHLKELHRQNLSNQSEPAEESNKEESTTVAQSQKAQVKQLLSVNSELRATADSLRQQLDQRNKRIDALEQQTIDAKNEYEMGEAILQRQVLEWQNRSNALEKEVQESRRAPVAKKRPLRTNPAHLEQRIEELESENKMLVDRHEKQENAWDHQKNLWKRNIHSLEDRVRELEIQIRFGDKVNSSVARGTREEPPFKGHKDNATLSHGTETLNTTRNTDCIDRSSIIITELPNESFEPERPSAGRGSLNTSSVAVSSLQKRIQRAEAQLKEKETRELALAEQLSEMSLSARKAQRDAESAEERVQLLQTYLNVSLAKKPSQEKDLEKTIIQSMEKLEKQQERQELEREHSERIQRRLLEEKKKMSARQRARLEKARAIDQTLTDSHRGLEDSFTHGSYSTLNTDPIAQVDAFLGAPLPPEKRPLEENVSAGIDDTTRKAELYQQRGENAADDKVSFAEKDPIEKSESMIRIILNATQTESADNSIDSMPVQLSEDEHSAISAKKDLQAALEEESRRLRFQCDNLEKRCNELAKEKSEVEALSQERLRELKSVQSQLSDFKLKAEESRMLQDQCSVLEKRCSELEQENAETGALLQECQEQLSGLQLRLSQMERENERYNDLQAQLAVTEQRCSELSNQKSKLEALQVDQGKQLSLLQSQRSQLDTEEILKLQSQCEALAQKLAELEEEKAKIEALAQERQEQLAVLQAQVSIFELSRDQSLSIENHQCLQRKCENLDQRCLELFAEKAEFESLSNEHDQKLMALRTQLSQLEKASRESGERIISLQEEVIAKTTELKDAETKASETEKGLRREISTLMGEMDSLTSRLATTEEDKTGLLHSSDADAAKKDKAMLAIHHEKEDRLKHLEGYVASLRGELAEARAQVEKLSQEANVANVEFSAAENSKNILQKKLEIANATLDDLRAGLSKLEVENSSMRQAQNVAESDLRSSESLRNKQQKRIESASAQFRELELHIAHLEAEKSDITEDGNRRFDMACAQLNEMEIQINKLEEEVSLLEKQRADQVLQAETKEQKLQSALDQLNAKEDELLTCQEELETAVFRVKALESKVHTLNTSVLGRSHEGNAARAVPNDGEHKAREDARDEEFEKLAEDRDKLKLELVEKEEALGAADASARELSQQVSSQIDFFGKVIDHFQVAKAAIESQLDRLEDEGCFTQEIERLDTEPSETSVRESILFNELEIARDQIAKTAWSKTLKEDVAAIKACLSATRPSIKGSSEALLNLLVWFDQASRRSCHYGRFLSRKAALHQEQVEISMKQASEAQDRLAAAAADAGTRSGRESELQQRLEQREGILRNVQLDLLQQKQEYESHLATMTQELKDVQCLSKDRAEEVTRLRSRIDELEKTKLQDEETRQAAETEEKRALALLDETIAKLEKAMESQALLEQQLSAASQHEEDDLTWEYLSSQGSERHAEMMNRGLAAEITRDDELENKGPGQELNRLQEVKTFLERQCDDLREVMAIMSSKMVTSYQKQLTLKAKFDETEGASKKELQSTLKNLEEARTRNEELLKELEDLRSACDGIDPVQLKKELDRCKRELDSAKKKGLEEQLTRLAKQAEISASQCVRLNSMQNVLKSELKLVESNKQKLTEELARAESTLCKEQDRRLRLEHELNKWQSRCDTALEEKEKLVNQKENLSKELTRLIRERGAWQSLDKKRVSEIERLSKASKHFQESMEALRNELSEKLQEAHSQYEYVECSLHESPSHDTEMTME